MKPKTEAITLSFPLQLADRELVSVTMRRPTMGDILDHPINGNGDIAGEMQLIGALCGLKQEDLRLMDAEDYWRLQDQLVRFRAAPDA